VTGAAGCGEAWPPPTRAATLATTLGHAGWAWSPDQPARLAHWIWSKGIGRAAPSMVNWTSLWSERPRLASERTHWDFTASADQITTTALAAASCSSMTSEIGAVRGQVLIDPHAVAERAQGGGRSLGLALGRPGIGDEDVRHAGAVPSTAA